MVYPAFGLVFAKGIAGFSLPDPAERRFQGDRNALWCVGFGVRNDQLTPVLGSSSLPLSRLRLLAYRITFSRLRLRH